MGLFSGFECVTPPPPGWFVPLPLGGECIEFSYIKAYLNINLVIFSCVLVVGLWSKGV